MVLVLHYQSITTDVWLNISEFYVTGNLGSETFIKIEFKGMLHYYILIF